MIILSALAARLKNICPPKKGIPADYIYLVEEGVGQVSLDAPLVRRTTLAITSGLVAYPLPDDFLFAIELQGYATPSPLLQNQLMYMGRGNFTSVQYAIEEQWEVVGNELVFDPAPTYTLARTLRYAGGYTQDADGNYPTLGYQASRAALYYAQFLVYLAQAGAQSHSGWSYSIGDESVSKTGLSKAIGEQSARLEAQYNRVIGQLRLAYGSKSVAGVADAFASGELSTYGGGF